MASISAATENNPNVPPLEIKAEKFGQNAGKMTEVDGTWFKIIKCEKSQFDTRAPFSVMAALAENSWNWLTKESPDNCYTSSGYCIVSCLFVPNENGGCFFLATIPRPLVRNIMMTKGKADAPIWYAAAETNDVIGGGRGNVHAEDAAEWLHEISGFWGRRQAVAGRYLPPGAGQPEVRLISWGKHQGHQTAGVVSPCPLPPFANQPKTPPCQLVARYLGINVWILPRRPTPADEASSSSGRGAGGASQGGHGAGTPSGPNQGGGAPQGGAANNGAGSSSATPGAGGNTGNTGMVDDLAAALARTNIGSRPSSSSSSTSNASTNSAHSRASAASDKSKRSDTSGSSSSSTPSLEKPGTKPSTQQAPNTTTTASSTNTAAGTKPKVATKPPATNKAAQPTVGANPTGSKGVPKKLP